jgi:hypothetical protein
LKALQSFELFEPAGAFFGEEDQQKQPTPRLDRSSGVSFTLLNV